MRMREDRYGVVNVVDEVGQVASNYYQEGWYGYGPAWQGMDDWRFEVE